MAKTTKSGGNGTAGVILGLAALIGPHIPEIIEYLLKSLPKPTPKPKTKDDSVYVGMPNVLDKNFTLTLSKVTELLENYKLKVLPIELPLSKASSKYKDCFEFQVIACDKKARTKLKPGDTVIVQYITKEVIDESRRIFEKSELKKAALKQERAEKRTEQIERAKTAVIDTADKVWTGFGKMVRHNKKKTIEKEECDE